jgi:predicted PurR-regulated permease PerM
VPSSQTASGKDQINRALEAAIHIGLAFLLAAACYLILRPFIPMVTWGIIIAVAAYPGFRKLEKLLKGRGVAAAALLSAILLAIVIVPAVLLGSSLLSGIQAVSEQIKAGRAIIPPPPSEVQGWPLIGAPLNNLWSNASQNLSGVFQQFLPQLKSMVPGVLSASAGIGLTVIQLLISIVIAGGMLAKSEACYKATRALFTRLFGEQGMEFQKLVGTTIRSVTLGIVGVAVIQSALAAVGFVLEGLPGAGLWSVMFLIAAVLQVGVIVLIPAVIYAFATATTAKAVIFLIWCLVVGLSDNVLKPLLLGRGAAVPILVVFLGAIGGFAAMGIIGLFIGAIVLSVGYKLFLAWLGDSPSRQLLEE